MEQAARRGRVAPPLVGLVLTLALTSSTAMVGVALLETIDGSSAVLGSQESATDRRHAEELTPMIAEVLERAGTPVDRIDRFAVDIGPGRFTGLRVGITTARTLALAADRPLVGVTSLEALAAAHSGHSVAAVIDARRAEVFQQRFTVDVNGTPTALDDAAYGEPAEMAQRMQPGDLVVGDGADRYPDSLDGLSVEHLVGCEPSAEMVARLSIARPDQDGPSVRPLYLRDPDVQINIKTRHNS